MGDKVGCASRGRLEGKGNTFYDVVEWNGSRTSPQVSSRVRNHIRFQGVLLVGRGLREACTLSKVVMKTFLGVSMFFQVVTAFGNMTVL